MRTIYIQESLIEGSCIVLQLSSNPEPVQKVFVTFLSKPPEIMLNKQLTVGQVHAFAVLEMLATFSLRQGKTRLVGGLVMLFVQES